MSERRRTERTKTQGNGFLVQVCHAGQWHQGRSRDISVHGIFVITLADIPVDQEVEVKVDVAAQDPICLRGRTVHHLVDLGVGIAFTPPEAAVVERIRQLIELLEPERDDD